MSPIICAKAALVPSAAGSDLSSAGTAPSPETFVVASLTCPPKLVHASGILGPDASSLAAGRHGRASSCHLSETRGNQQRSRHLYGCGFFVRMRTPLLRVIDLVQEFPGGRSRNQTQSTSSQVDPPGLRVAIAALQLHFRQLDIEIMIFALLFPATDSEREGYASDCCTLTSHFTSRLACTFMRVKQIAEEGASRPPARTLCTG